ncbi:multidrug resistance-associated protein 4, partial [Nannochloropsis gaditana CCMP526]|uniref:multidrug resistance-associated protein 4 n=1 Tax=Nannochloropsis gaditana (strain CCMP526) TaxID=1093141 RepID=UPI00029F523A
SGSDSKSRSTLRNVSLAAPPGKILGLAGPVGCGHFESDIIDVGHGSIAYASQEPWILTGSVRENILMGRPYEKEKYIAVLKAACLETDLTQWEHADYTVIGDRGLNMSGG